MKEIVDPERKREILPVAHSMKQRIPKAIQCISTVEIALGLGTFVTTSLSLVLGFNTKPFNVLAFVYCASMLSFIIGTGLLRFKNYAYELLLFFAPLIIITKILIFTGIIQLNGALEPTIPAPLKDSVSIAYHGLLIWYLRRKHIRALYTKG